MRVVFINVSVELLHEKNTNGVIRNYYPAERGDEMKLLN